MEASAVEPVKRLSLGLLTTPLTDAEAKTKGLLIQSGADCALGAGTGKGAGPQMVRFQAGYKGASNPEVIAIAKATVETAKSSLKNEAAEDAKAAADKKGVTRANREIVNAVNKGVLGRGVLAVLQKLDIDHITLHPDFEFKRTRRDGGRGVLAAVEGKPLDRALIEDALRSFLKKTLNKEGGWNARRTVEQQFHRRAGQFYSHAEWERLADRAPTEPDVDLVKRALANVDALKDREDRAGRAHLLGAVKGEIQALFTDISNAKALRRTLRDLEGTDEFKAFHSVFEQAAKMHKDEVDEAFDRAKEAFKRRRQDMSLSAAMLAHPPQHPGRFQAVRVFGNVCFTTQGWMVRRFDSLVGIEFDRVTHAHARLFANAKDALADWVRDVNSEGRVVFESGPSIVWKKSE